MFTYSHAGVQSWGPSLWNTLGKEPVPQDPGRLISHEALRECRDRNYHQILPIIAEKVHQEKEKGPERKAMFKRLEKGVFHRLGNKRKSVSVHSDDSRRWSHHSSRRDAESCHQSSRSRAIGSAPERRYNKRASSRRTKELSESEGGAGGH
ncbi:hypothetical protein Tco_1045538 [Tanacetum coccineum]|uniref:Uncharacterized protein n=1 Tax=Tanacetum coccineum TaxID=301880 RepID=A0ABQ5GTF9_9ASTR